MTKSAEELEHMARPLTPKSERLRAGYGSLLMSMQTVDGRCPSRKCIKRADHPGTCWPKG